MKQLQQKKHYPGCGILICLRPVFSYPKSHPCHGCPYTFGTNIPSCITGDRPGDCAWYFYRSMMERSKPAPPAHSAEVAVIDGCIEKLCRVAERKFGRKYADQLRLRRFPTP